MSEIKKPPGIKRATERAKESKSVLPVAGARQARQAIQGYLGMDPSFSVMDPEAQALESAYRGGETASVLGDLFASLTPFGAASAAAKANQVPGLAELIAYHGSPHKFKKFDASKIGTGEGAQAYGHGLYFAENPAVAKSYQSVGGYLSNDPVRMAADTVSSHGSEKKALSHLQSILPPVGETTFTGHTRDQIEKAISAIKSGQHKEFSGSLYTVDIPDEKIAQMLDWDKPLSQQPAAMQVARKVFNDPQRKSAGFPSITDEEIGNLTGQDLYRAMTTTRGGLQPGASKSLLQEGIPGIQYLDQASRDAKQGTRNFVVFPGEEQNIKMLDINGEPQMAKGGKVHISDNLDTMRLELMRAPRMQDGGSVDQFLGRTAPRGVSALTGYGQGKEDVQQALTTLEESPVGRIASGVGEFAEGYMSGAGSTDLQKIGQGLSMIPVLGLPATVSKTIKTARVGDAITDSLRAKYPNVDISVIGDDKLHLSKIVVPKDQRNQGLGTQVMDDLVKQADDIGATVTLSPSADFGGNKERLKDFYKRFGFVQNKGRNKDFTIWESMYRAPKEKASFKAPQDKALLEAQRNASLPIEQGGLGLPPDNTADMRAAAMGYQDYYHGTERLDRLLEKEALDPRRATSGPMPYGAAEKEMASRYATSKRDTSRLAGDEGDVANYFTVSAKDLGSRSKADVPVEKAFYFLPREKQQEIISKMSRIGYENPREASGDIVLHPEGTVGTIVDPKTIDYYMRREAKGNPLTALRMIWHDSGTLFGNEEQLAKVFELSGFPLSISQKNAPWSSAQGVLTGKVKLEKPLMTTDSAVIEQQVIPALKQAFAKNRTQKKPYGPDQWSKDVRFTPKEWVAELEKDMAEGKNSFVWTSIPDKVTAELRKLGFDGVVDVGGKGGGSEYRVVIPFDTKQVRSRFAAFDPKKKDQPGLLKAKGGKVTISDNLDTMRLELLRKKHA